MFTTPRAPRLGTALVAARCSIRAYVSLASNALTDAGELLAAPLAMATKLAASVMLFHDGMDADASASTSSGVLHRVTARHIRLWSTNVRESSSPPARVLLNRLGAALSEVETSSSSSSALSDDVLSQRRTDGAPSAALARRAIAAGRAVIEIPGGQRRWTDAGNDANAAVADMVTEASGSEPDLQIR